MNMSIRQRAITMMLALGIMLMAAAPGILAQDRCSTRRRTVTYNNNSYGNRYDNRYDDRNSSRNDRYDDRYDDRTYNDGSKGRAVKRTGIGAAGGAVAGGLIGGRKGVLIGGIAGAAAGYVYHRHKENQRRY
ncbi:MAG: YMGG-like glycine zipper-containing protein [Blastocatellia bacterium]